MAANFDNAQNPMGNFHVDPGAGNFPMRRGFTMSMWVKPANVYAGGGNGGSSEIFGWNDNSPSGSITAWFGFVTATGYFRVVPNFGTDFCTVPYAVTANKWLFVSFAYKPRRYYDTVTFSNAAGRAIVSPVDEENFYTTYQDDIGNYWPGNVNSGGYGIINRIQLGSYAWNGDAVTGFYCFNGDIGPVKIWNSFLTDEEIQNEKWSLAPKRTAGLFAYYPMVDSQVTDMVRDYSGNGHDLTSAGTFGSSSYVDNPPVSIGAPVLAMTSISGEEIYNQNISPKTNSGVGATISVECGSVRAGETQIVSISYKQATVATTPTGWTLLTDTISGSVRNCIFYRIAPNDAPSTNVTFSLGASSEWTAHALTTVGRIGNVANAVTSSGNVANVPSITIPTAGDYWLHFLTNVGGNAKIYVNNTDSTISIISAASANSNVTAGVSSIVALKKVNASGVITAGNIWNIYDAALGTGTLVNNAPRVTSKLQSNIYDSITFNNSYVTNVSTEHEVNYLWKRDSGNVLNYNVPYTVMFDYFHVPANDGTYKRQQLWTLTRIPGMNYGGVYAYDALLVDDSGNFSLRRAEAGYNYFDEIAGLDTPITGRWQNVAIVSDSNLKISYYINGTLGASLTSDPASRTAVTAPGGTVAQSNYEIFGTAQFGDSGDPQYFTGAFGCIGAISNIKEWNIALSDGEILEEIISKAPRRTGNLFAWYPLTTDNATIASQVIDANGTRHMMVNKGTIGGTGPIAAPAASPFRVVDTTLVTSLTITPPNLKRGLLVSNGNFVEVPTGSEKTGNVMTLQANGSIQTANIRNADFYTALPSGRALVIDAGNIRALNANTDILIR